MVLPRRTGDNSNADDIAVQANRRPAEAHGSPDRSAPASPRSASKRPTAGLPPPRSQRARVAAGTAADAGNRRQMMAGSEIAAPRRAVPRGTHRSEENAVGEEWDRTSSSGW